MPVHEWTQIDAGIFHAFHHGWLTEISRALNRDVLPPDHYALCEQHAAEFSSGVLALQQIGDGSEATDAGSERGGLMLAPPKLRPIAETDMAFYHRKQKTVTVRHVSGDRIVAIIEIVSPGNKAARNPLRAFVAKAAELLDQQIHLLIVDLLPRGRRDPDGIHSEIWQEIAGEEYAAPNDKPFTLASYESGLSIRAYVVHKALGELLTDMPLFLEPEQSVQVPLEATYMAAFNETPRRWCRVLDPEVS